jgi:hypothetical protein
MVGGRHIALVGDHYPRTQCLILYLYRSIAPTAGPDMELFGSRSRRVRLIAK